MSTICNEILIPHEEKKTFKCFQFWIIFTMKLVLKPIFIVNSQEIAYLINMASLVKIPFCYLTDYWTRLNRNKLMKIINIFLLR